MGSLTCTLALYIGSNFKYSGSGICTVFSICQHKLQSVSICKYGKDGSREEDGGCPCNVNDCALSRHFRNLLISQISPLSGAL